MDNKKGEHPDDIVHRPHGRHALTEQATLGARPPSRMLAARDWRAAALLGLISSSYSTLINQLGAARVGRDAAVDWMSVAAIPARDWALQSEPSWSSIAIGIGFHQSADFSWALVFFGLLGRWTSRLSPGAIAILTLPWAVLTSALEWFLLVPIFPFIQPIFTLQHPYWIGLVVHSSSAVVYPLFSWLRWPDRARGFSGDMFMKLWSAGLAVALALTACAAVAGARGYELPLAGRDKLS